MHCEWKFSLEKNNFLVVISFGTIAVRYKARGHHGNALQACNLIL